MATPREIFVEESGEDGQLVNTKTGRQLTDNSTKEKMSNFNCQGANQGKLKITIDKKNGKRRATFESAATKADVRSDTQHGTETGAEDNKIGVFRRLGKKVDDRAMRKRKIVLIGADDDPKKYLLDDEVTEILVASDEKTVPTLKSKLPKMDSAAYRELEALKTPQNPANHLQLSLNIMIQRDKCQNEKIRELLLMASSIHMEIVNCLNDI